jgi:hypothetical protein
MNKRGVSPIIHRSLSVEINNTLSLVKIIFLTLKGYFNSATIYKCSALYLGKNILLSPNTNNC